MTNLKINGFLSIDSATIDIRPFTVLIGPQAQGKSVIAKLTHYFEVLVRRSLLEVVSDEIKVTALKRSLIDRFIELFPREAWSAEPFAIAYTLNDWVFTITRDGSRRNASIQLTFSKSFEDTLIDLSKEFKPLLKDSLDRKPNSFSNGLVKRRELRNFFDKKSDFHGFLNENIFVPASRSFFANIEKNIFSLISSNYDIDPLMAEFGATLEQARMMNRFTMRGGSNSQKKGLVEVSTDEWRDIIQGGYLFDGKDEFIVSKNRRVKLANSSSGQQEVLPLLIALNFNPRIMGGNQFGGNSYFVEEPEAHLFPYAQKSVAELLARKLNETQPGETGNSHTQKNSILVTTHSPYILTAFNNLMLAGQLFDGSGIQTSKIEKIVPRELAIDPKKVAAYKVLDGSAVSIVNKKTQLIDSYLIDEISEEFAKDFDALLTLESSANTLPNKQSTR